jgi:glycerophosphoryl diester phosphodiesterase
LVAFEHAAELGADVLEMDVHMSADGVLVLMHDATVDRTTDGSGAITGLTLAELQALDAGYDWTPDEGGSFPYRGQGIRVPALREVLSASRPAAQHRDQAARARWSRRSSALREFRATEECWSPRFTTRPGRVPQRVSRGAGLGRAPRGRDLFGLSLARVERRLQPGVRRRAGAGIQQRAARRHRQLCRAAHGRNIAVHPWTINSEDDLRRMLALGVDGSSPTTPTGSWRCSGAEGGPRPARRTSTRVLPFVKTGVE